MAAQQSGKAQALEVRAVGTLSAAEHADDLTELLIGLSGAAPEALLQHEVVLAAPPAAAGGQGAPAGWRPDLRLQHNLQPPGGAQEQAGDESWTALQFSLHLRGKQHAALPAVVRHVTRARCAGGDVPAFWRALGFAPRYQLLRRGHHFRVPLGGQEVEVTVCAVLRLPPSAAGSNNLPDAAALQAAQDVSPGRLLVEAVAEVAGEGDHMDCVAAVTSLAALLAPYTTLQRPPRAPGEPL